MQKYGSLVGIGLLVFGLDQLVKAWIITNMVIGQTIDIVPPLAPYFQITRVSNTGIAFGIFTGGNTILLILTSLVVVILGYVYHKLPTRIGLQHIAFAMIIGGALGNIVDRIRFGYVVDFVHIIIPNFISNVSNFADHFVVIGTFLILLDSYLQERRENQQIEKNVEAATRPAESGD